MQCQGPDGVRACVVVEETDRDGLVMNTKHLSQHIHFCVSWSFLYYWSSVESGINTENTSALVYASVLVMQHGALCACLFLLGQQQHSFFRQAWKFLRMAYVHIVRSL